jgi:glutamate-ammonia-ligase adenylyltransferase
VPGAEVAVLAFGKLGSRELTASSDLDLVFVYDFGEAAPESNGARRLHAVHYHSRLAQRLVTAITAPTRRGILYEVDLRLRPTGSKASAALQFSSIAAYYEREAETWELMALTRARFVAGDVEFGRRIEGLIDRIVSAGHEPAKLKVDIRSMRALIAREKGDDDPDDLKLVAGGLVDCEFLGQYATLCGAQRGMPRATDTETMLARGGQAGLFGSEASAIVEAYRTLRDVQQWQRLAVAGSFRAADVAAPVLRRIATSVGLPDWRVLQAHLSDLRGEVRRTFERVLGAP